MRAGHLPRGSAAARLLLALGIEHGLSAAECLRGTGLNEAQLADPLGEISAAGEQRLIANLIVAFGDDAGLGLEAGRRHVLPGSGMLGFGCLSSATLRTSLEFALRYQDLAFTLARADLVAEPTMSFVELGVSELPAAIRRFVVDQQLATLWAVVPAIAATPPPAPRVELRLKSPTDAFRYRELFGVDPVFGAPIDRFGLPNGYLDAPLPQADPAALELCETQCMALLEQRASHVGVAGLVHDRLSRAVGAIPSMDRVAADIHTTTRTLRRSLAAERTSFREIDRAVRMERAEELLSRSNQTLDQIAARLGYTSSSSFVHAFRRWYGTTPGAHRTAARR